MKIILDNFGETLGINKDSFTIRASKTIKQQIPFWKTNEIIITSKNTVSVDALLWASLYNVDVVFCMHNGKPLAFLHPITDKANVKTRINQLKAYESRKGLILAKTFLCQKIENENRLLKLLRLEPYESNPKLPKIEQIQKINAEKLTKNLRLKLQTVEERFSRHFYAQVFPLFPKWLRINKRIHRNATEPLNNLLNISFEVLEWKILKAVIKSKLEPYLGYCHSIQRGKPSLVLDLIEPFRAYIVYFLINYSKTLKPKDFQRIYIKNQYPRYFLTHKATWQLIQNLNKKLFETYIPMQRNRKHGFRMQFETYIDEYVSLTANYINSASLNFPLASFPPFFLSCVQTEKLILAVTNRKKPEKSQKRLNS